MLLQALSIPADVVAKEFGQRKEQLGSGRTGTVWLLHKWGTERVPAPPAGAGAGGDKAAAAAAGGPEAAARAGAAGESSAPPSDEAQQAAAPTVALGCANTSVVLKLLKPERDAKPGLTPLEVGRAVRPVLVATKLCQRAATPAALELVQQQGQALVDPGQPPMLLPLSPLPSNAGSQAHAAP